MGYSWSNFTYIGTAAVNENELATREAKAREAFARDPYGCRSDVSDVAETGRALDRFNERATYRILDLFRRVSSATIHGTLSMVSWRCADMKRHTRTWTWTTQNRRERDDAMM